MPAAQGLSQLVQQPRWSSALGCARASLRLCADMCLTPRNHWCSLVALHNPTPSLTTHRRTAQLARNHARPSDSGGTTIQAISQLSEGETTAISGLCQVSHAANDTPTPSALFRLGYPLEHFAAGGCNLLAITQLKPIRANVESVIWFPDKAPPLRLKPAC